MLQSRNQADVGAWPNLGVLAALTPCPSTASLQPRAPRNAERQEIALRGRLHWDSADSELHTTEKMIQANGIEICTEAFGEPNDVPILLVMGARVAVLDAYDIESAHAVGPSLGGLTVQHLALDHRSRVRTITPIMSLPDTSPALLRGYEKQWSE